MKKTNRLPFFSRLFIFVSALNLLSVSLMAFANPQMVMDMINMHLPNTDAYSSIRGVYGGVGFTLAFSLLFLQRYNIVYGLALLSLLWGSYALSRIITLFAEGSLGSFGNQWLLIETILFLLAGILLRLNLRRQNIQIKTEVRPCISSEHE